MRIEDLSMAAQDGLRQFCLDIHNDELMLDAISSLPEHWAWLWFQLREAEDNPRWFPKGKWATIQHIETLLIEEAKEVFTGPYGLAVKR